MMRPIEKVVAVAAADYASAGWPVFPLTGKIPFPGSRGFKDAGTDPERVARLWSRHPSANIATALPATLMVVDVDAKTGGLLTLHQLTETLSVPETLTVLTGGGGLHLYFLHPGGELRQGAGILGPGVDTRIPGKGYVVLPPSLHPSGRPYEWFDESVPAAAMPRWMIDRLRPEPPRRRGLSTWRASAGETDARLVGLCKAVAQAPEGRRNDVLNWAAWRAGDTGLDETTVVSDLTEAARQAGLDDREIARTIASALGGGS